MLVEGRKYPFPKGSIYFDTSNKSATRQHKIWTAEIGLAGCRMRRRSPDPKVLERWLVFVRCQFKHQIGTSTKFKTKQEFVDAVNAFFKDLKQDRINGDKRFRSWRMFK